MKQSKLEVRVLKEDSCPSLSGRSLLAYQVGCTDDSEIQVRVSHNTGNGFFSKEWIAFSRVAKILDTSASLTSSSFRPIFEGKSVNTAGFLLAILEHLGVIRKAADSKRSYEPIGSDSFISEVSALAASPSPMGPETHQAKGERPRKPKKERSSPLE